MSTPGRIDRQIAERLGTLDTRSLGLFRIAFGLVMLGNLFDRVRGTGRAVFYANDGVLANHYALFAPLGKRTWSLLFPFSTTGEVTVAFVLIGLVFLLYTIGYKTKLSQIVALVCLVSIDNRNLLLENSGVTLMHWVALTTLFLPLGERFSVDAMLRSYGAGRESAAPARERVSEERQAFAVTRVACFGVLFGLAFMYAVDRLHEADGAWREGTAVHYMLWQDRAISHLGAWIREHQPGWAGPMTRALLGIEALLPLFILSPVAQKHTRRIAIVLMIVLHGTLAALFTLGATSYVMMSAALLLLGPWDWVALERFASKRPTLSERVHGARARLFSWRDQIARSLGVAPAEATNSERGDAPMTRLYRASERALSDLLALACLAALCAQARGGPSDRHFGDAVVDYLRLPRQWGAMFTPDPLPDDGTIVVDATLADHSHVDPLTGRAPDFEPAMHGPRYLDGAWSLWFEGIHVDAHRNLWQGFREYITRLPSLEGWSPNRRMTTFDVYWVSRSSPAPGSTSPSEAHREHLFSWTSNVKGVTGTREP